MVLDAIHPNESINCVGVGFCQPAWGKQHLAGGSQINKDNMMVEGEGLREDLIFILGILSDKQRQQQIWGKGKQPREFGEDFNFMLHLLFDDTRLGDDPFLTIGGILENETEAQSVGKVTSLIWDIIDEKVGNNQDPHKYINHPEWSKVVDAAKEALHLMS